MSPRRNYGFERRQRETLRRTRQEAKKERKAERSGGEAGPEMGTAQETGVPAGQWEWFSPSRGRVAVTAARQRPAVDGARRLGPAHGGRRRDRGTRPHLLTRRPCRPRPRPRSALHRRTRRAAWLALEEEDHPTREEPMDAERPLPTPITPEAKPYWDGAREGKLMIPKCHACGKAFLYPARAVSLLLVPRRRLDPGQRPGPALLLRDRAPDPQQGVQGQDTRRPGHGRAGGRAAPADQSRQRGTPDPKALRCDMPVEVVFEKLTDQISLPMFQPAKAAAGGAR